MDTILYLKPREGLTVREPRTKKPLPEYGKAVSSSSYWRRRLKDGDVVKTTAESIKKAEAKAAKASAAEASETIKEG
jgi:hypothetical protein